jgi:hypothetical protein
MPDCSAGVSVAMADSQVFNQKILQDSVMSRENQAAIDNQEDARESRANARAWESIKLDQAQIASRRAQNAATVDKMLDTIAAIAISTGETENEQTVSPADTAMSETAKGAVGTANAQVAANVADLATSLVPVIASALATAISQSIAALVPVVVNAAGGASTPSQTQAKPTS